LRQSFQRNPSNTARSSPRKPQNSAIPPPLDQLHQVTTKNPKTIAATPDILAPDRPDPAVLEQRRTISRTQFIARTAGERHRIKAGSAAEPAQNHYRTNKPMIYRRKVCWFRSSAKSAPRIYVRMCACAHAHQYLTD
jgi:hypothetical protein